MLKELTGIDVPLVTKECDKALPFNLEQDRLYYLFIIPLVSPFLLMGKVETTSLPH